MPDLDLTTMFEGLKPDQAQRLAERIRSAVLETADPGAAIQQAYEEFRREVPARAPVDWGDIEARGTQLYEQYEQFSKNPAANFDQLSYIEQETLKLEKEIRRGEQIDEANRLEQHAEEISALTSDMETLTAQMGELLENPSAHYEQIQGLQGEMEKRQARLEDIRAGTLPEELKWKG